MTQRIPEMTPQGLIELLDCMGNLDIVCHDLSQESSLLVGLIFSSFAWTACDLTQTQD